MPEISTLVFNHKEVATALVKAQNIHEGLWGIYIEFGFSATNINQGTDSDPNLVPAVIVPLTKIGIQRFDKPNNLTVDAAEVNPE